MIKQRFNEACTGLLKLPQHHLTQEMAQEGKSEWTEKAVAAKWG